MGAASCSSSSVKHLFLLCLLLGFCFAFAASQQEQQQSDSCSSAGVAVAHLVPFNSSAFRCLTVWKQEDFVLRYKNTGESQWSFILSAPDKGSYVAVGFSGKGLMVGSSAVVAWSSGGKGTVKQYYLTGKSPDECYPDKGRLTLVKNKAVAVSRSGRLYLAFQLSTDLPQPHLIYAVGPEGNLPPSDATLPMHRSMHSHAFNYTSGMASSSGGSGGGGFPPERKHGLLAMMAWGVLMPLGMMAARYFRRVDPYWFYAHMAIQAVAFTVGIASVILGFRLNEDGLKNVDVHRALGIAILAMASLQVMAFLARPDKTSKVRRFWNWYHHYIGRAAILVAIGNIFLGLHIAQEVSAYIVSYGVFVAVWVIAVAAFEMNRCYSDDD
uniref:Cytochrome b561 and DOMON domain-containing protein n=1 Tax=Oryza glumipatula TaxID=40148 RepID=A0A0D9ZML1_9ORYZ